MNAGRVNICNKLPACCFVWSTSTSHVGPDHADPNAFVSGARARQAGAGSRVFWWRFFFQAEDGIRDFCLSRGLGDVYKRQDYTAPTLKHEQLHHTTPYYRFGIYQHVLDSRRFYRSQPAWGGSYKTGHTDQEHVKKRPRFTQILRPPPGNLSYILQIGNIPICS